MIFNFCDVTELEKKYLSIAEQQRNEEEISESKKEMLMLFKELNEHKCVELNISAFFDLLYELFLEER